MHLLVVGLNHRTAPIELRERLAVTDNAVSDALCALRARDGISECVILSTCNRTEVYAVAESRSSDKAIIDWMCDVGSVSIPDAGIYSMAGHKAAEHLFRVSSGLDSMVLGEAQILRQVKDAYATSSECGCTSSALNNLFQQAIAVGKRARTETEIGRGVFSVGSVAAQLARSVFGELEGRTALIIGAGKMAELTLAHLASFGLSRVLVTNRTYEKAVDLASRYCGEAVPFEDIPSALNLADIVVASTGSEEPIITLDMADSAMRTRNGRPILFVDIAVPRDIEPSAGELDNVFVYNIDDLQAAIDTDTANRKTEITKVESIICDEIAEFNRWFRELDAVPIITALREKLEEIRAAEFEKIKSKLPDLSPEELEAIETATRSIVNKMSHQPIVSIKEQLSRNGSSIDTGLICDLFGLPRERSSHTD